MQDESLYKEALKTSLTSLTLCLDGQDHCRKWPETCHGVCVRCCMYGQGLAH